MGQQLLAGASAGTVALVVCYPMDVVRTRMMVQGGEQLFRVGVLGTARLIAQQEGFKTFYRGFSTAVVAVVPSNAVFYWAYDALRQRHLRRQARGVAESGVMLSLAAHFDMLESERSITRMEMRRVKVGLSGPEGV